MLKKLLLTLGLVLALSGSASAQNVTCTTRPTGDSSNACASTAFVQGAITTGSVTSVGLALPVSVFSISGSPVTTTGTLTGSFVPQSANIIFAGPTTGSAAAPTFRAQVIADLPNSIPLTKLATQATNTVVGNATSGAAVPTALAVPSCSTASSVLRWTTNTGFGCGTIASRAANPGNLYVATTGNDANTCLVGTPCLTLQRAVTVASYSYDLGGSNLIINIGTGSFAGAQVNGPMVSGGYIVIKGNGSTNTTITSPLIAAGYAKVQIGSMKLLPTTGENLFVYDHSLVYLYDGDVNFGASDTAQILIQTASGFEGQSGYGITFSGSAPYGFLMSTNSWAILSSSGVLTFTGTPNYSGAFVNATVGSTFNPGTGTTFSGTATGRSYALSLTSSIDMEQNPAKLPGTGYGNADYSSSYYGVPFDTNNSTYYGLSALSTETTGIDNTAIGSSALLGMITGSQSTAVGSRALTLATAQNDAFGYLAGNFITTSVKNVAIGNQAMAGVTGNRLTGTGSNTAVGYGALLVAQGTANTNTAIGTSALAASTTANSSTAVGYQALLSSITTTNTALGTNAGEFITSGADNIAIGKSALIGSGGAPITGSQNNVIGHSATINGVNDSNETVIGYSTTGIGSNTATVGNSSLTKFNIGGGQYYIAGTQIAASNLSNGTTGSGSVVLATSPQFATGIGIGTTATTGNSIKVIEGTAPGGVASAYLLYASPTAHRLALNNNNGGEQSIAGNADNLSFFAATTSAQMRSVISDESGTGAALFQDGALGTPLSGVATNLTGTASGLTAGAATNATNTAITDDTTTNATMYPTWVTANTGNLPQKVSSTGLSFNPSTGLLTSTGMTSATYVGTGTTDASSSITGSLKTAGGLGVAKKIYAGDLISAPATTGFYLGANVMAKVFSTNYTGFYDPSGVLIFYGGNASDPGVTFNGDYTVFQDKAAAHVFQQGNGTGFSFGTSTNDAPSPTQIITINGQAARTILLKRNTTAATAGQGLTVDAGGAIAGTNNLAGGNLAIKAGISTGTGTSSITLGTADIGASGSTDNAVTTKVTVDYKGHIGFASAAVPTISSCGTTPSAARGSDAAGEVTEGTAATSCTITFAQAYTAAPYCVVTSQTQFVSFTYTISTTAITITNTSASSDKINWVCHGI